MHNTCVLQYNPGLGHLFSHSKMFYLLKDSIRPGDQHLNQCYIKIHYKGKGGARSG